MVTHHGQGEQLELGALQLHQVDAGAGALVLAPSTPPSPAAAYLARLGPGSRRTMRGALDAIASFLSRVAADAMRFPWHQVRYEHAIAVRAHLVTASAPATANKVLCALRAVLREAWRLEQMSAEEYHRAAGIENVRGERPPAGRDLSAGELRALFATCDATTLGTRDAAVLALLYQGGLRRAEASAVDVADYAPATGDLTVHGKGQKVRIVYLSGGGAEAIAAWLARRGDAPGPLLQPVRRGGGIDHRRRLHERAVHKIVTHRIGLAELARASPHDFRRTFIGDLLDGGNDVSTVQKLAGHASASTTTGYDRRPAATRRRAAAGLHVPFRR